MDETPDRPIVDHQPVLGQLGYQPSQGEIRPGNARAQPRRVITDNLGWPVPAHLTRRNTTGHLVALTPLHHARRRDAQRSRHAHTLACLDMRYRTLPKIHRIRFCYACWPPAPAHRLNQNCLGKGAPKRFRKTPSRSNTPMHQYSRNLAHRRYGFTTWFGPSLIGADAQARSRSISISPQFSTCPLQQSCSMKLTSSFMVPKSAE